MVENWKTRKRHCICHQGIDRFIVVLAPIGRGVLCIHMGCYAFLANFALDLFLSKIDHKLLEWLTMEDGGDDIHAPGFSF